MGEEITSAMVEAAVAVLREHYDIGGYVDVNRYIHDGMTPDERAAGIAALKAADQANHVASRAVVAEALAAALRARTEDT